MTATASLTPPAAAPPRTARTDSTALVVLCAVQLLLVVDVSVVNIGLGALRRDLGVSTEATPWVVAAYSLTYGGLLLLGGRAGDLMGRRRALQLGVLVFGLASLLAGLAPSTAAVLAARAGQGVGSALAAPAVLALLATTFPQPARRARAMALYAAMSGAGAALGLVGGGLLVQAVSWRAVFLINIPVVAGVLALAPRVLRETPRRAHGLAAPSAVAVTGAATALSLALSRAATSGWGDALVTGSLAAGALLAVLLVLAERRAERPLVPTTLLTDGRRVRAFLLAFVVGATLLALLFLTTQLRQGVHGTGAVLTGLGFLPFSAAMVTTSQLVGRGPARWRSTGGTVAGLLLAAVGAAWLAAQGPHTGYLAGTSGPLVLAGTGIGLVFVPLTLAATAGVDPRDTGVAGGLLSTSQVLGGALGVAAATVLAQPEGPSAAQAVAGYDRAFTWLAVTLAAAGLAAAIRRR